MKLPLGSVTPFLTFFCCPLSPAKETENSERRSTNVTNTYENTIYVTHVKENTN